MTDLTIEVHHNKELFFKITRYQTARQRKQLLVLAIVYGLVATVLIVGSITIENMHAITAGFFFAIFCAAFLLNLSRLSSKSVMQMIEMNIEKYPLRSIYSFSEDGMTVETDFQMSHSKSEHEYSFVSKVCQIDGKTICILLKSNTYCAIESDNCQKIMDFLSAKLAAECFKDSKDGSVNLAAVFLCILGGFIGLHQFYYKNVKFGIIYIYLPADCLESATLST